MMKSNSNVIIVKKGRSIGVGGELVVYLPYASEWIERIRMVPGRRWDHASKQWLIPMKKEAVAGFCHYFDGASCWSSIQS